MPNRLSSLVQRLYHAAWEPALVLRRRRKRLAALGVTLDALPIVPVRPYRAETCSASCRFSPDSPSELIDRYVSFGDPRAKLTAIGPGHPKPTPMVVDLAGYSDMAAFEAVVRKRSSRTMPKVRKALRAGYRLARFPLARHLYDVHAVKTSMAMRTGGPVLDYWFLKPEDVADPGRAAKARLKKPGCPNHWIEWFGVFRPEPGHLQGEIAVDEKLVAYAKLTRRGELIHYADWMGHRDHLEEGVMAFLHVEIIRWLMESGDPLADGVRIVLYGGAEHGRDGLLTWKKRAGFDPALLMADEACEDAQAS